MSVMGRECQSQMVRRRPSVYCSRRIYAGDCRNGGNSGKMLYRNNRSCNGLAEPFSNQRRMHPDDEVGQGWYRG